VEEEGGMSRALISVLLCFVCGCECSSRLKTRPQNAPFAWEYNAPMEGFRAARAGWKQLTAPKGMEWDELVGSYRQKIGGEL
jgi:hypothetical protein